MKAEASWALLGLTCRLAQALGLHRGPGENTRFPTPTAGDLPKRKLWYVFLTIEDLIFNVLQVEHCLARQLAIPLFRSIPHCHHDSMSNTP